MGLKRDVEEALDELEAGSLDNQQHEIFCRAFAQTGNATTAAREAGYANPPRLGWQVALRPDVKARVAAIRKILWGPNIIEQMEILERLSRIVRVDPAELFNANGQPLPLCDVPVEVRDAIEGIEHKTVTERDEDGKPIPVQVRKIALASKSQAYNLLMRYYRMVGGEVNVTIDMAEEMDKARARAAAAQGAK